MTLKKLYNELKMYSISLPNLEMLDYNKLFPAI